MQDRDLDRGHAYGLLSECALFRTYRDAFQAATGLPLILRPLGEAPIPMNGGTKHGNEFCEALAGPGGCSCCREMEKALEAKVGAEPITLRCFAGMRETVVPVRHAGRAVALLKTGEVLESEPRDEDFMHIAGVLLAEGRSGAEIRRLREAYFKSPVVDGTRYAGMVVLLATFGRQLSEHLTDLMVSRSDETPMPVRKALELIQNRLDEHLSLDEVAMRSGLSVSQFCKVFKEATGTTFTEHVNRRRIEWARRELLRPGSRVTEVAYKVGFTSLSQFNRSFLRYVGEAPRDYRRRRLLEVA